MASWAIGKEESAGPVSGGVHRGGDCLFSGPASASLPIRSCLLQFLLSLENFKSALPVIVQCVLVIVSAGVDPKSAECRADPRHVERLLKAWLRRCLVR